MKLPTFRSLLNGWRMRILAIAVAAAGFFSPSPSYAVTSGPGVWDFMIFGNYDLTTINTGAIYSNFPTGFASPTWNKVMNNGYGGGVGLAYWFNDTVALRIDVQTSLFTEQSPLTGSVQSSPLTGGIELKLWGDPDYYLYFVVDAGAAYESTMSGTSFFGSATENAWTAYGDAGLGLNLDFVFIEAKVAYMPQFMAHSSYSQNGLWYVPVTAGFNF